MLVQKIQIILVNIWIKL